MTHPFPDLDRCPDALAGDLASQTPTRAQQGPGDGAAVASDLMTGDLP